MPEALASSLRETTVLGNDVVYELLPSRSIH